MAVPTPLAFWKLNDAVGSSFATDSIGGITTGQTVQQGTGGVFGNSDTKIIGETSYYNQDSPDNASRLITLHPFSNAVTNLLNDSNGSISLWIKTTYVAATNNAVLQLLLYNGIAQTFNLVIFMQYNTGGIDNPCVVNIGTGGPFTYASWANTTDWSGEWIQITVTWDSTVGEFKTYIDGQLLNTYTTYTSIGAVGVASPSDYLSFVRSVSFSTIAADSYHQYVRVWDVTLTDAQAAELYETDIGGISVCQRTIPLAELREIWTEVEKWLPCKGTIQIQGVLGFTEYATNVPMSIELTGTTRELDSSDNFVSVQSWLVQMSGRVNLPNPGVFSTIRFLVAGLTLESYDYYQSPDDTVTTIECRKV